MILNRRYGGPIMPFNETARGIMYIQSLFPATAGEYYLPFPEYLYQDAAGTIPVTADGDPVRLMLDLSGNGKNATAQSDPARPIYRTDGSLHWLEFDGATHLLRASSSVAGISALTMCIVSQYDNPPAIAALSCYRNASNTGSAFLVRNTGNMFTYRAFDGTLADANYADGFEGIPSTFVLTYTGANLRGRQNGSEKAAVANTGALQSDTGFFYIGGIDGSFLAEQKFYGSVNLHKTITTNERLGLEYYMSRLRPAQDVNIFLVGGQSNADGRNAVATGPVWVQDNLVDGVDVWDSAKIIPLNLTDIGENGNGSSWVSSDTSGKFSFATIALKTIADTIGSVVVCQVTSGGTPIAAVANTNGSWNSNYASIPSGTPKLLQELESRYADLIAFCAFNNITPTTRALIWHQGEGDVSRGEQAGYAVAFSGVMTKVRDFTDIADLPLYYGTIAFASDAYDVTVNTALTDFAAGTTNAYCRDNYALTLLDAFHFDATSSETFGSWVATEYLS